VAIVDDITVIVLIFFGFCLTMILFSPPAIDLSKDVSQALVDVVWAWGEDITEVVTLSKGGKQRIADTGLIDVSTAELEARYKSSTTSKEEKKRIEKELKSRREKNKKKRENLNHSRGKKKAI
jgi:hypothetical protein